MLHLRLPSPGRILLLALILGMAFWPETALAGEVVADVPEAPAKDAHYLFYLHGGIIEVAGERPTRPGMGTYEYRKVLAALAEGGFVVISEARPEGTVVAEYAEKVVGQVKALLEAGVPVSNVTVVGFSKGGNIAVHASTQLANPQLTFVLLGACGEWVEQPELKVSGRILSIHELSDTIAGSCEKVFANAAELSAHQEIRIETGKDHGAFYEPRPEWLEPTLAWARGDGSRPAAD